MITRSDENTFLECINKLKEPVARLNELMHNDQISYTRVKWDVEGKRAELGKMIQDIDLLKEDRKIIQAENEKVKQQGLVEKKLIVQDGIKFLSEANILLVKVKNLCSEVEKRQYMEFQDKSNELLASATPEVYAEVEDEPKKRGRPFNKDKVAA